MNSLRAFTLRARGREPTGPPIVLDMEGLPHSPCPDCAGQDFHKAPGKAWGCSACVPPPVLMTEALAGWEFCALPETRQ
jgi:hypothetical protein